MNARSEHGDLLVVEVISYCSTARIHRRLLRMKDTQLWYPGQHHAILRVDFLASISVLLQALSGECR